MKKTCVNSWCGGVFEVTDDDLAFYKKVSPVFEGKKYLIPSPTLCPDCRQQRRLAFRNERNLHRRTCDLTGASIISAYAADAPYTVYESSAWWSDQWDPLSYGKEFDFTRSFFGQFDDLRREVPRIALVTVSNENAEYVNWSAYNKNSYLLFAADYDEDCLYGTQIIKSQHCVDTLVCTESAYCYDLTNCERCHGVAFSKECSNCGDSLFLSDCRGCSDCILCTNLRSKRHCVRNQQLTPDEYKRERIRVMEDIHQGKLETYWQEFLTIDRASIHRAAEIVNCEDASGNYLANCQNVRQCFDLSYAKDCAYVCTGFQLKDIVDYCHVTEAELGYECMSVGFHSYGVSFAAGSWSCKDSFYVDSVHNCSQLFGCVGLRSRKYCILNTQYTKEVYETLVPKIIEHMRATPLRSSDGGFAGQEWGEFYPLVDSPFPYNETLAAHYFPLTQKEVAARGYTWSSQVDDIPTVEKTIDASRLPSRTADIPDDILNWAIICEVSKRPFRIVKQELAFYRERGLPVPHLHPDERHRRRMALRNPRKLWARKCMKCGKDIQTTYAPQRPEIVYCEECYLASVY